MKIPTVTGQGDYDRAVMRRLWARRLRTVWELVQAVLAVGAMLIAFALMCLGTPDQLSAEADWQTQFEKGGAE